MAHFQFPAVNPQAFPGGHGAKSVAAEVVPVRVQACKGAKEASQEAFA